MRIILILWKGAYLSTIKYPIQRPVDKLSLSLTLLNIKGFFDFQINFAYPFQRKFMRKTIFAICGLLMLVWSAPVQADTLYFALQAGFSTQPSSSNQDGTTPGNSFELDTSLGYNAALAVGAKFGMFRAEVEGVYRVNDNDSFNQGGTPAGADGDLSTANIFLNGYLDIDLFGIVSPYAGVGVGYGKVSLDLKNINGTLVVDDNDTVYSYQLIAGAAVNVSDSWSLTAEYRYFDTITDAELSLNGAIGLVENSDIRSHEIRFGIRYWFF